MSSCKEPSVWKCTLALLEVELAEVQEGCARGSVLPLSPLSSSPVSHLE